MRFEMRRLNAALAAALCGFVLSGCNTIRDMAGLQKKSPDEFAVTTKAPLVIPPDFNLRPPMPGAPPANTLDPSSNAQQALFNNSDPQTVANGMRGNYSPAEKLLLAHAGTQNSDPAVRARLSAEERARQNADRSFTNRILSSAATRDTGRPVNADAAISTTRSGRRTTTTTAPKKEDSGGWFDWF
ncbi:MAG: hypothetical protein RJB58_1593 [Pseudomonadota bacterium]